MSKKKKSMRGKLEVFELSRQDHWEKMGIGEWLGVQQAWGAQTFGR